MHCCSLHNSVNTSMMLVLPNPMERHLAIPHFSAALCQIGFFLLFVIFEVFGIIIIMENSSSAELLETGRPLFIQHLGM